MDANRLTEKTQEAIRAAQGMASRFGHQQIDNEHLLAALLSQEKGIAPRIVERAGGDPACLLRGLEQALARLPGVSCPGSQSGQGYITARLEATMQRSAA